MRIAFLGTRGIPRCYSGFETFVEELAVRLARRGHEVTVYNRVPFNPFRGREFQGVRLVALPTIRHKWTDTIVHTALSVIHAAGQRYDVAYVCGVGNALLAAPLRWCGPRTLVNVDGADHAREKWSGFGRWWLRQSEGWAAHGGGVVIADHPCIQKRYRELYGVEAEWIPYGAKVVETDPGREVLRRWNLAPGGYLLYVSRLTPENRADWVMEAYLRSGVELPLVVVGDAPYQEAYLARLRELAGRSPRIHLTGYVFGEGYAQLSYHARAFVYPTQIDATRPVVLDQMGFGNAIVAYDTEANRQVVGEAGLYFGGEQPLDSLAQGLREAAGAGFAGQARAEAARRRVREHYDWEVITGRYEALFDRMLGRTGTPGAPARSSDLEHGVFGA